MRMRRLLVSAYSEGRGELDAAELEEAGSDEEGKLDEGELDDDIAGHNLLQDGNAGCDRSV